MATGAIFCLRCTDATLYNTGMKGRFELREQIVRGMNFDLRITVDGIVRSWSVPKGPSMNPDTRRLAVATTESLDFGSALIWDRGEFCSALDFKRSWEKGWLVFTLEGTKLKGRFMLERSARNYFNWSLYKLRDEYAGAGLEAESFSNADESWSELPLFERASVTGGSTRQL